MNPLLLSLLHFVLAAGVTVHVLLTRREAGSSAAWIGLAWLAPILGSVLYWLLGINRVRRRARQLRAGHTAPAADAAGTAAPGEDALAALERTGLRVTQRPVAERCELTLLQGGDEAYPQMIAAIGAARHSIALSSYIFRGDAAGSGFVDALIGAGRRGVAVRVLIDGVGGGYFHSAAERSLRRGGIRVGRFMHSPRPWRMPFVNLRCHRKILTIDGGSAFTGGLNIGAENLSIPAPVHPVVDTHFRVTGPVVAQLTEVFAEDWLFTTGERLAGDAWFPPLAPAGRCAARVITSGPDQDVDKIELMILEALGCARESVKIMTPYFLPDERMLTALALAAYRGAEVDLVLPERSNHPLLDWAARVQVAPLLAAGCRVWTHPPPFDHSKLMTVDARWCLIGSANWDMRSFRLNFEVDLEVYRSAVVSTINERIASRQIRRLESAQLGRRPLPLRLRDSAARLLQPYL